MRSAILFFTIMVLAINLFAQESKAEWELVSNEGSDKIFIDTSQVESSSGGDIYAWTITQHSVPIVIESVDGKIYKTNTYYLFNTRLNKYSLLYIIYYDKNKNVLASFDYQRKTKIEAYQYNYPIWKSSLEKKILEKCVQIINREKNK